MTIICDPILKVNNWTFFVNPKCGIRTINKLCLHLNTLPQNIFKDKKNIIIFRCPYNRLLSGYLNKYVQHSKYLTLLEKNNIKKEDVDSFYKFLNLINKKGICILDKCHFSLQTELIPEYIKINKIFITEKISSLIEYINTFIEKINNKLLLNEDNFKFEQVSKYNMNYKYDNIKKPYDLNRDELNELIKNNKLPSYMSFYTDELKKIVIKKYRKDIQFYNNLSNEF